MTKNNGRVENSENFHPIPSWLDKKYLEKAIRHSCNNKTVHVLELDIAPAIGKGENYASIMFRIRVKFITRDKKEPQTHSYILKMSFEGDHFAQEKLSQYDIYKREMDIYEKIFPQLRQILSGGGQDTNLFPRIIFVDYEQCVIIFEDLLVRSYVMAERKNGLDMAHAKLVLQKLAKMQAASAVLAEIKPETFQGYDRGMFNRYTNAFSGYFEVCLEVCGQLVSTWDDYKDYGEKLTKLIPYVMEYGKRDFDIKDNFFNTLVHGDLWVNNVMFKYDSKNEPIDVVMIDFQYCFWGSPVVDLHWFLNTSLRDEIRLHQQDDLVQYYYNTLKDTLKILNFKGTIPSLREFLMQFMEKSFYAFISACLVQPVMINEKTENADFAALMGNDERAYEFKRTVYTNEKVHKNLKQLLPIFDRKGLLDIQFT